MRRKRRPRSRLTSGVVCEEAPVAPQPQPLLERAVRPLVHGLPFEGLRESRSDVDIPRARVWHGAHYGDQRVRNSASKVRQRQRRVGERGHRALQVVLEGSPRVAQREVCVRAAQQPHAAQQHCVEWVIFGRVALAVHPKRQQRDSQELAHAQRDLVDAHAKAHAAQLRNNFRAVGVHRHAVRAPPQALRLLVEVHVRAGLPLQPPRRVRAARPAANDRDVYGRPNRQPRRGR